MKEHAHAIEDGATFPVYHEGRTSWRTEEGWRSPSSSVIGA